MENLDAISKINPAAINADGSFKDFKAQLLEYEYGYWSTRSPFVLLPNSLALSQAGVGNYPITMTADTLKKLKDKHDIPYSAIGELAEIICDKNVLMLQSYTFKGPAVCMYLDEVGCKEEPLFAAFHLDKTTREVFINELSSVYERANVEHTISKTYENGLKIWPNEKTEEWLNAAGLRLPGEITTLLNGNYAEFSKNHQIPSTHNVPEISLKVNPQVQSIDFKINNDLDNTPSDPPFPGTGADSLDKAHDKGVGPSKT